MKKIFLVLGLSFLFIDNVWAIPPPDILMSTLQSVIQGFGIAVVFLISLFFLVKDYLLNIWNLQRKKCIIFGVIFLIFFLSLIFYFLKDA